MATIMAVHLRAVTLGFLSSFSIALWTWQYSHSTPSEAAINCIDGTTWSAATPLRVWIFLNCSSASLGGAPDWAGDCCNLDCAFRPEKPRQRLSATPLTTIETFRPFPVMDRILAGDVTNARTARF